MLISVCEDSAYNLLGQRNYFQKHSLVVFVQKYVLEICSIFTGGDPHGNMISKCCVALLHGCSTVNLLQICRTPLGDVSVFYIICVGASNKEHLLLTSFYNLQIRICRLIKSFLKVFFILWYIFFEIISQLLAVTEATILFLFQSLVWQMSTVIAEAVPHSCSS